MRSQTLPLKVKLKFVTIKSGGQYVNQAIFIFIFKFQMNDLLLLFVTNLDSQLHVSLHNINYYLMRLLKFCITNVNMKCAYMKLQIMINYLLVVNYNFIATLPNIN